MNKYIIILLLFISCLQPQQPTDLTALVSGNNIQLEWQYNDSLMVQGFTIHQDTDIPCLENQFQECQEECIDNVYLAWLGDEYCDDGGFIILNCPQWSWDFGDCDFRSEAKDKTIISVNNVFSILDDFSIIGASPDTSYTVNSVTEGCFYVSSFISDCCPYEVEILESSNTVCVGDCLEAPTGDVNNDDVIDILDIVRIVNIIIGSSNPPTLPEWCTSDLNLDSVVDIIDIIIVINIILEI